MKTKFLLFLLIWPGLLLAQQIADTSYHPIIRHVAYDTGKGPVVFIDEGHHNFHTKEGRYKAFSNLLEQDGYVVKAYEGPFDTKKLKQARILVISNALNEINVEDWYLPNPSAFSEAEIRLVRRWVKKGGNLFLIADHMPMAGAARDLAGVFGFEFTNGFVFHKEARGPAFFNLDEGTLIESAITKGRDPSESVHQIATFTGQAFQIPEDAQPVLVFDDQYINYLPDTAWVFDDNTPQHQVPGWSQGACKRFGKGKIAAFGEAMMFSAQLVGPEQIRAGMSAENAPENHQLLLNLIHWLDGIIE